MTICITCFPVFVNISFIIKDLTTNIKNLKSEILLKIFSYIRNKLYIIYYLYYEVCINWAC